MFGIGYEENYTVIHDGAKETEPFIFLYACGQTKQGGYVSGLVIAKEPKASTSSRTRIDAVAQKAGFEPSDWCNVDNSCSKSESTAFIV